MERTCSGSLIQCPRPFIRLDWCLTALIVDHNGLYLDLVTDFHIARLALSVVQGLHRAVSGQWSRTIDIAG